MQFKHKINYQIKASEARVIDSDGNNLGVLALNEALRLAKDQGLDLVEINGKSLPIIVKIIDYGKFKYEEKKKNSEAKKTQKIQELKEITFRPTTDENDLNHKLQSAKRFLEDGDKVKFTVRFKGREMAHPEVAQDRILWILEQLKDLILAPLPISFEGKLMSTIVSPAKKN